MWHSHWPNSDSLVYSFSTYDTNSQLILTVVTYLPGAFLLAELRLTKVAFGWQCYICCHSPDSADWIFSYFIGYLKSVSSDIFIFPSQSDQDHCFHTLINTLEFLACRKCMALFESQLWINVISKKYSRLEFKITQRLYLSLTTHIFCSVLHLLTHTHKQ